MSSKNHTVWTGVIHCLLQIYYKPELKRKRYARQYIALKFAQVVGVMLKYISLEEADKTAERADQMASGITAGGFGGMDGGRVIQMAVIAAIEGGPQRQHRIGNQDQPNRHSYDDSDEEDSERPGDGRGSSAKTSDCLSTLLAISAADTLVRRGTGPAP